MKLLSAPISICLGITNQCNLNCKHCLASETRHCQDLNTSEMLGIIKQIQELKIFTIAIFGGEPLVRKDFFTLLDALCETKTNLSLSTNGTLITVELARKLARYPIKNYTVSLDGSSRQVHDPFRDEGSFDKVMAGIRNLLTEKRHVMISVSVTRFNHEDLENIVLLGHRLGVQQVRFNSVVCVGNAAHHKDRLVINPGEKFKLLEKARVLKKRWGNFVTGSLFQACDLMDDLPRKPKETFPLKVHPCGAAVTKCAITPDGEITPCEILWNLKAGNLKSQSLRDLWLNSSLLAAFRKPFEIKESEIPECKGCDYLSLCYKGHRCHPYYSPGAKFEHKEFYCWRPDVVAAK